MRRQKQYFPEYQMEVSAVLKVQQKLLIAMQ